jgi:hypothetical protein
MLTRFHKILIAALAVQLVLVVFVLTRSDDNVALKERPVIAGFDAAKVTRLQVFAGQGQAVGDAAKPLDLVKRDAGWVLASGFDYPVDAAKVTDVLGSIGKASAAAPIATQAARHKQLHVADADFERKLVVTMNGKDLTVYVGGPAGARRTAVRVGASNDVFGVTGLSAGTIGSEPRAWVDPSYVKLPTDEISKVVVQRGTTTVELSRPVPPAAVAPAEGSGSAGSGSAGSGSAGSAAPALAVTPWSATVSGAPITLAAGESLDTGVIDRLVGAVATIDLAMPADVKLAPGKPAVATITIERKTSGATPAPTVIDVAADGAFYWVHDRSSPRAVLVEKARLDDVVGVERDKLVKKPAPPTPAPAAQRATPPGPGAMPAGHGGPG